MNGFVWRAYGLAVVLAVIYVLFLFVMHQLQVSSRRRNKKHIEEMFRKALAEHGAENLKILKDCTTLGSMRRNGKRPFEVYRTLYGPPNRWFIYIHIEGSDPVLMPISEKRAMASVNS